MVLHAALYIMAGSYLQTRLLVHDYEKMVKQKKKSDDRSARALSCGVGPVGQAEASGFGHLQAQHVSRRYSGVPERGIHEVIGVQGIPVNAVIEVRNSKGLLIRRYCRASAVSI